MAQTQAAAFGGSKKSTGKVRKPINFGDIISYTLLTIAAILVLMPLAWMFSTSLRPTHESFQLPPAWLPTKFSWENYVAPFESSVPFVDLFINSMRITVAVTLGQLVT
ncbi:MAG: carbohydrate ABC transporter permease, partial [Chloroflexi bacterium]|nr:carbohydrate ABC transporter permease [Chloroflexota bacterium]